MMNIYAVRDKVAKRVAPPFAAPNPETAVREFKQLDFGRGGFKEDFQLIFLGQYDETSEDVNIVMEGADI